MTPFRYCFEESPSVRHRANAARQDRNICVVFAKREYEAWFLAAADPEAIRGAKEWLGAHMPPGQRYRATLHQAALTEVFDLDAARRAAPSFDKLWQDVSELLGIAGRRG